MQLQNTPAFRGLLMGAAAGALPGAAAAAARGKPLERPAAPEIAAGSMIAGAASLREENTCGRGWRGSDMGSQMLMNVQ